MSESDINNLCNLMRNTNFTGADLKFVKDVYDDIKNNGVSDNILPYYLEENDILIQAMLERIDMRDIDFLHDMMDQYINMNGCFRKKLSLLFTIYENILDILGEL